MAAAVSTTWWAMSDSTYRYRYNAGPRLPLEVSLP
jgi:hypothetical protein